MFKKVGFITLLCMSTANFAIASEQQNTAINTLQGLSTGLGFVTRSGIYIGEKSEITPIPVIGYETNGFFIRGLSAGAEIYKDKLWTVNAIAHVNMMHLDIDDLSTTKLAAKNIDKLQLEDRDRGIDIGVQGLVRIPYGLLSLEAVNDVAGASKGAEFRLNYQTFFKLNSHLSVVPNIGLEWLSDKRANYYYGILKAEVERGMTPYKPDDLLIPHLSLGASYAINDNVRLSGNVKQKFLPHKVKDGPLIDKSSSLSSYMALTYSF